MKAMAILTLCFAALTLFALYSPEEVMDSEATFGWAFIMTGWSIAYAITNLTKMRKS